MSAVTQYEIDWRTERLAKTIPSPPPRHFTIGLARSGYVKNGGTDETWQLFTGNVGSSMGYPIPEPARAFRIVVAIVSNNLSEDAEVRLMKNEEDTDDKVTIPAGQTGNFVADVDVFYDLGDRVMLHFVAGGDPGESIGIAAVSIAFEPV
jgi:hypothetical protein